VSSRSPSPRSPRDSLPTCGDVTPERANPTVLSPERTAALLMAEGSSRTHMLSGASAGFAATILLHPLDLIKTRFHVQEHGSRRLPQYVGLIDACRKIVHLEGVRGLYAGLWPNLFGNTVSWGLYMYAYNRCKEDLEPRGVSGSLLYVAAATFAGSFVTLCVHPVFTVKTRLMLQLQLNSSRAERLASPLMSQSATDNYRSTWNAVSRMLREEGVLSFYRGIGPSLLLVSHGTVQFLVYEHAKGQLAAFEGRETSAPASPAEGQALSTRGLLASSALSKICATFATYPYQVVRSCMQQRSRVGSDSLDHFSSIFSTFRHLWRTDRIRGFYRGILPHLLRSTPQASITLLVYEHTQKLLFLTGIR